MRIQPNCRRAVLAGFGVFFAAAIQSYGAATLVFPQFVSGGGYVSTVTLVNTNFSTPVAGILAIYRQNGTPRTVAMEGRPAASVFTVTIPPGGTAVVKTTPVQGDLVAGMATFTSDFPVGGVVRFEFAGGQVGVLNAPGQSHATLVLNTTDGNDTGVAIANPGKDPINISLVNLDEDGQILETVDPPELNPLPPNGQTAKFVTQLGLKKVADRAKGSIQINVRGAGEFSAFALLLRNGQLSSTAVVRGAKGKFKIADFDSSYAGQWKNTTFGSQGDASLTLAIDDTTQLVSINVALTGNVFGGPPVGTTTLHGTLNLVGLTATGDSPVFGFVRMTIGPDGAWTLAANDVPSSQVRTFTIEGAAHPDKITGNYTVTFRGGPSTAQGTISLTGAGGR